MKSKESNSFAQYQYSTSVSEGRGNLNVEHAPQKPKRKRKYRQAKEGKDGMVEILCFSCRRSESKKIQPSLSKFIKTSHQKQQTENNVWSCERCTLDNSNNAKTCDVCGYCNPQKEDEDIAEVKNKGNPSLIVPSSKMLCSRCRKNLNPSRASSCGKKSLKTLPIISRLQGYKKLANEQNLPFTIPEHECIKIMRRNCEICGDKATEDGHGITRLCKWPEALKHLKKKTKKPYMGPFCKENVATACKICNLMKGHRKIRSFVEAARHIATNRREDIPGGGENFGRYPERFRNNISRRSRSAYITKSSTHQKTHCLTNQQFADIVKQPCHYCGKESDPPNHYNGLDRLDSHNRVYAIDTVVSCCGDCNIMKYKHSEEFFLNHCLKIAKYNRGRHFNDEN